MAVPCNVLINLHPMVGADPEKTQPPGPVPPLEFPANIHACFSILNGIPKLGRAKKAEKTKCYWDTPMKEGTDIGKGIIHIGAPNIFLPIIMLLTSKSKCLFGASSVKLEDKSIAAACLLIVNWNLNCAHSFSKPLGFTIAPNTVQAGMTLGDYLAGIAKGILIALTEIAIRKLMETGPVEKAFEHVGDFLLPYVSNSGVAGALFGQAFANSQTSALIYATDVPEMGADALAEIAVDHFIEPYLIALPVEMVQEGSTEPFHEQVSEPLHHLFYGDEASPVEGQGGE